MVDARRTRPRAPSASILARDGVDVIRVHFFEVRALVDGKRNKTCIPAAS